MPLQITQTPDTLPDYHFFFVAPNVETGWLFDAARSYYDTFRPTIIIDGELLKLVPVQNTVAVSLLTQRDAFRVLAAQIAQARPNAMLDALVYETLEEATLALNNRAASNQPFGVPLTPTATPSLREPILPTPGAIVGGGNVAAQITPSPTEPLPAAGFITLTPSPTPEGGNDNPINPTPGAIVGDS